MGGKHLARINAEKRLWNAGKMETNKKLTYEDHLKLSIQGSFGKKDTEKYVEHFFMVTPNKDANKACCENCIDRLTKNRKGIRLSQLQEFVDNMKALDAGHSSFCNNTDVLVSKCPVAGEVGFVRIKLFCPQCKKGGSFKVEEITDPRLRGCHDFIEFRCNSFSRSSKMSQAKGSC